MNNNKIRKPNIVRGGIAIPLGRNYYYMRGRKHKQGGIDIGKNPRTGLEVEDGEVMHVGNKDIKVFSSLPFLNGKSPAQRVISGENPNAVFNAQERFKKRNKINDDGTKKKRIGGQVPNRKYITNLTDSEEKEFQTWYSKVAKYKNLNPNPDAAGQDYDYRGYWKNEDREGILGSNPNAHFTDKYKQPTHPTFSNESIYSNNKTPGGSWIEGKGTWLFKHNKYTARQADRTADYLNGTGEGFILGTDTIIPNKRKRMGRTNRINKYKAGGLYTLSINGKQTLHPFPSTGEIKLSQRQELTGTTIARAGGRKRKVVGGNVDYVTAPGYRDNRFYITSWEDEFKKEQDYINKTKPNPNAPDVIWRRTPKSQEEIDYDNSITDVPQYLRRPFEQRNDIVNTKPVTNPRKSFWSKAKDYLKENPETISDAIGLVSNLGSSLIGMGLTNHALNKMKYSSEPIPMRTAKLKTRININPQLDRMRESLAAYEHNIDSNTGSSQIALARKQRARLADVLGRNELYGDKENKETELINADRINQQEVANKNIESYNTWVAGKAAFENSIAEQKANNRIAAINNINAGVQQVVGNIQQRMAEGRTLAALSLGSPNLPAEMFYASGIWNKRMYDAYRRAYPLKRK